MNKKLVNKCIMITMDNLSLIILRELQKGTNEEIIKDEILIDSVKEYPVLYDKTHPDYKDFDMKKDAWIRIKIQCGIESTEKVRKRWTKLRNYFVKRLRDTKINSDSGSDEEVKIKRANWYLGKNMSFLMPHIESRGDSRSKKHFTCTSYKRRSRKVYNDESIENDSADIVIDSNISSGRESFVQNNRPNVIVHSNTSSVCESFSSSDSYDLIKTKSDTNSVLLNKRKDIPELDTFEKKKQKNDNDVETLLAQSTSALTNLATVVHESISKSSPDKIDEQTCNENPFAESIAAAFDRVPMMKQMDCLIATLNIIKNYQADQTQC